VPAPAPNNARYLTSFSLDIIFIAVQGGFCTVAGQKRRKKGAAAGTAMSSGQVATIESLTEGDCKKSGNMWTKVSGTLSTY
jgi:hypothetical protein